MNVKPDQIHQPVVIGPNFPGILAEIEIAAVVVEHVPALVGLLIEI